MIALLLAIGKRARELARDPFHGARVIRRSTNLPIYLALTASVCCALGFIILAGVWWQDMAFIAGEEGQDTAASWKNHLRQVQHAFTKARSQRVLPSRTKHGRRARVITTMASEQWDPEGLLAAAGIKQFHDLDDPDADGDGLTDSEEKALGTNPRVRDSDGDELWDGVEIKLGLDPNAVDSEGDGVKDRDRDRDGDGYSNLEEQHAGSDPRSKNSVPGGEPPGLADGYLGDGSLQVSSFSPLTAKAGKRKYTKRISPASPSSLPESETNAPPARRRK